MHTDPSRRNRKSPNRLLIDDLMTTSDGLKVVDLLVDQNFELVNRRPDKGGNSVTPRTEY